MLLAGCGSHGAPPAQVTRQCLHVRGEGQTDLTLVAPRAGLLLVTLEERGLSVSANIDSSGEASSPVSRLGAIALLAESARSQTHTLHVRTQDDRELSGEVCATLEIIPAEQTERRQAELAFAAAARAAQAGDWQSAFASYLSAARGYDSLGLSRSAAQARYALSELAYRRFDRKRDSYALASLALEDYGDTADPVYTGALLNLQAKALLDLPGSDAKVMEPAIRARLTAARRHESASTLGFRELLRLDLQNGFLEYSLEAQDRATAIFSDVAQRCRNAHDWDCYASASQNLALFAEERSNYALALAIYSDALHSLDARLHPRLVADIQDNLGHLQGHVGLFSASELSHAEAMRKYARLGDCPGFRRTLARAGSLLVQVGTLGDAEQDLAAAASLDCPDLLASVENPVEHSAAEDTSLQPVGVIPRDANTKHHPRSLLCQRSIDAGSMAVDNQLVVFNALLSLGDALQLQGETAGAERCINAAQTYAATARARMRLDNARGAIFLERGEAQRARLSFEQTLRIAGETRIPQGNEHLGYARLGLVKAQLLAGDSEPALHSAYRALQTSVARGDIEQTVTSLRLVAGAHRATGKADEAAHALQVALALSEAVPIDELDGETRATYLATQHTVFTELTDLFASQAASDEATAWRAFEVSELGRARSLRYAESQETRDAAPSFNAPPAASYQQLVRELVQLQASSSESSPQALLDAVASAAARVSPPPDALDQTQMQHTLQVLDATLIEYAVGSHDMFAFVLDAHALSVVRLGERTEISAAVSQLRDRLRDAESPAATVREAAQHLAQLVIWPLRAKIAARRIIFVPDDSLHTIPFAVLPWSSEMQAPLMVERAETVVAPSALFLTRTRVAAQPPVAAPRIELIGDPIFRISDWRRECLEGGAPPERLSAQGRSTDRAVSDWTESLPRLPGTRTEVSAVAKLARQTRPGSHVETLLGCAAVPNALRAAANGGADLLHIATHARVDAERPRLSALALTPDPATSSPTSAFGLLDILGLKLSSRLVVLSACDTSRGRLLPGEGVLGPAQAFLQAGSAAVLASYWRIDDAATASFMQRFYMHLFAEHLPAAAALRSAQLEAARNSSSHTWAAFALYGWPDSSI